MALVKIFGEIDTVFTTNGDKMIKARKTLVHDTKNSDFYLDLEVSNELTKYINDRCIVAVNYRGSWQGFRIGYKEILQDYTYYKAMHVSYDMKDYLIKDLLLDDIAFNIATQQIKAGTTRSNPFTISTLKTVHVDMEIHNNNLLEVVFGLVDNYNCDIIRDNYTITLRNTSTKDSEISIEYGKNLVLLNEYCDTDSLVTELYPTMLFDDKEYTIQNEKVEDTSLYGRVYTKHVEFYPMFADYYNGILEQYNDLLYRNERLESDIESYTINKGNTTTEIVSYQQELVEKKQEVIDVQDEYARLIKESNTLRTKIFNTCNSNIALYLKKISTKIGSVNAKITSKNNQITSKENLVKSKQALYSTYSKKRYMNKAKAVKAEIAKLRSQITALKSSLRTLERQLSTEKRNRDKLYDYQKDFSNINNVTKYDITQLFSLLKGYGLKQVNDIAEQFYKADNTVDNADDLIEEVNKKYEYIYELEDKITALQSEENMYADMILDSMNQIDSNGEEALELDAKLTYEIQGDLLTQAQAHLKKYKYPQVTYEVESLPIDAYISDKVLVKNAKLGLDLDVEVVYLEYDCILEKVTLLQFGNTGKTIADMQQDLIDATTNKLAQTQVLLENAYSNMMSKVAGIDGYVTGIQVAEIRDGENVNIDSQLAINEGRAAMKVTESKAKEIASAEIEVKADSIKDEVIKAAIPEVLASVVGSYTLNVTSSDGQILDDDTSRTILQAKLMHDLDDITNVVDSGLFVWTRRSTNAASDVIYNRNRKTGPSLTVNKADINDECTFTCTCNIIKDATIDDSDGNPILDTLGEPYIGNYTVTTLAVDVVISESMRGVKSKILQLSDKLLLQINDNGKIMAINMETGETQTITISADNINLEGITTVNGCFKINKNGAFEAIEGKIADWTVSGNIIRKEIVINGVIYQVCLQAADGVNTTNNIYVRHSNDGINWIYDFALNYKGKITANDVDIIGGTIGGWGITSAKIYGGDPNTGVAFMQIPSADTTYVFGAGGSSHSSYADCPFRVTKYGKMYSLDADISGGKIGGFNISSNGLRNPGGTMYIDPVTGEIFIGNTADIFTRLKKNAILIEKTGTGSAMILPDSIGIYDKNGVLQTDLGISSTRMYPIYKSTTTSGANVNIDSSGDLRRVASSSERYKRNLKEIDCAGLDTDRLLQCGVFQYNYEQNYITDENCYNGIQIGFSADDLYKHYPISVELDEEGRPEKPNERILLPAMFDLIKKLDNRVRELEKKVGETNA